MATLLSFAQLSDTAPEAGGVLIGRHILGGSDVVVDRVTIPMAGDRRARTRFAEAAGGIRRFLTLNGRAPVGRASISASGTPTLSPGQLHRESTWKIGGNGYCETTSKRRS
jgi:hypothetical protein